jgi:ketosteroid isomerase-like protein
MSQENVETVRRYYERLNARDVDGCLELLAPDIEIAQPDLPDGGAYSGTAGWRRWNEALEAAWSEMRWEPQDFVDAGDAVLVAVRFVSRGSHTAIEQGVDRFQVIRVRDGRIVFTTGYGQRAQALEAVGLSE